jgi:hypothetical protein
MECKGVLISDYGFGFVSPEVTAQVVRTKELRPVTLDSRFGLLQHRASPLARLTSRRLNKPGHQDRQ